MAPNLTEIAYALGAGNRLVGVTLFCDYPPEVKNLPKVGGWLNPDLEKVISLRSDMVLLMKAQNVAVARRLSALHVPYLEVRTETIKDILQAILQIGNAVGEKKRASELVRALQEDFTQHRRQNANKPRKKVFWVLGRTPGSFKGMLTPSSGTFMDEIIELAGGQNMAHYYGRGYIQVSLETLFVENPDVIIETYPEPTLKHFPSWKRMKEEEIKEWRKWRGLKAIQMGEIYRIYDEAVLRPSHRIQTSLHILNEILNGREGIGKHS